LLLLGEKRREDKKEKKEETRGGEERGEERRREREEYKGEREGNTHLTSRRRRGKRLIRRYIFEWRGSLANRMEIAKAMDLAGRIKNKEFSGRAEMFVLEEDKNDHHAGFWYLLLPSSSHSLSFLLPLSLSLSPP
jgi:hypothetical protein